jgi:hypothetical protein
VGPEIGLQKVTYHLPFCYQQSIALDQIILAG